MTEQEQKWMDSMDYKHDILRTKVSLVLIYTLMMDKLVIVPILKNQFAFY